MPYQAAGDIDATREFAVINVGTTLDLAVFRDKAFEFRDKWFQILDPEDPAQEPIYRWIIPMSSDISKISVVVGQQTLEDMWRMTFDVSNACAAAANAYAASAISSDLKDALIATYNDVYSV